MTAAEQGASIVEQRKDAVRARIAAVRRIETEAGVNRDSLERIKTELVALASAPELFPTEDFPLGEGGKERIYLLSEDADGRFALYMSTGHGDKLTPPHDHTTWAVIVGVRGKEHNHFYQRVDDGSVAGKGEVREMHRFTVEPGTGVCLMPDDIHAIACEGEPPTLMLHMYGLALDRLDKRVAFNMEDGTYHHFGTGGGIIK